MITLSKTVKAWDTDSFNKTFTDEICTIPAHELPLQEGMSYGSVALSEKLSATVLHLNSDDRYIVAKTGLFYTSIIAGCSCADDPSPVDEINEYCEATFKIDKRDGKTTVSLQD